MEAVAVALGKVVRAAVKGLGVLAAREEVAWPGAERTAAAETLGAGRSVAGRALAVGLAETARTVPSTAPALQSRAEIR